MVPSFPYPQTSRCVKISHLRNCIKICEIDKHVLTGFTLRYVFPIIFRRELFLQFKKSKLVQFYRQMCRLSLPFTTFVINRIQTPNPLFETTDSNLTSKLTKPGATFNCLIWRCLAHSLVCRPITGL